MLIIFIAILIAYIVVGTIIALLSKRYYTKTLQDYFVASYRLGSFLASMTYAATTYSAFMMVGLVGLTFTYGVVAFGFEIIYLFSTIVLLSTIGLEIWRRSRVNKWISPSDMLRDLYDSNKLGFIVSIVYLIALIPYTSAQIIGIGEIFKSITENYVIGVLIASVLILLWIVIAGIWSVASTDAYQGIWMLSAGLTTLILLILFLIPSSNISVGEVLDSLTNIEGKNLLGVTWSLTVFLGYSIPWIFFALTNPQVVQRLYMPRDKKAFRNMVFYFAIFGLLYTVIVTLIGLLYRGYIVLNNLRDLERELLSNRDSVTPSLLKNFNEFFASYVFISIIAAAVSTANSIILTVASVIVRELYERMVKKPVERISRIVTIISIVVMTILSLTVALLKPAFIVELSVISSVMLLPLAPITILGLYKKKRDGELYAITSLITGFAITLILSIVINPIRVIRESFINIPIVMWILIVSTIPLIPLIIERKQ